MAAAGCFVARIFRTLKSVRFVSLQTSLKSMWYAKRFHNDDEEYYKTLPPGRRRKHRRELPRFVANPNNIATILKTGHSVA